MAQAPTPESVVASAARPVGSGESTPTADKVKLINRLKRLEGQVRGLQRMVEEERDCHDILTLLSGVRSALNASGDLILETYLEKCQAAMSEGGANSKAIIEAVKLARG